MNLREILAEMEEELEHAHSESRPDYSTDVEVERLRRWCDAIRAITQVGGAPPEEAKQC